MAHGLPERNETTERPLGRTRGRTPAVGAILALCLAAGGCAGLEIKAASGPTADGLHFYRPAPYLTVSPATGGCTIAVEFLPDYSVDYVIVPHGGVGTVTFNPTLDSGGNLTSLTGTVDSQTSELVTALGSVITAVAPLASHATRQSAAPASPSWAHPGLYKLNLTSAECGGRDTSLKCVVPVLVNETASCASVSPAPASSGH
jgi:hypothetical protein